MIKQEEPVLCLYPDDGPVIIAILFEKIMMKSINGWMRD
jgi:hypothetical protein